MRQFLYPNFLHIDIFRQDCKEGKHKMEPPLQGTNNQHGHSQTVNNLVVNLSSYELTHKELSLLNKGLGSIP
ncbi:hypothetical protein XENTR_v10000243 [Xenopus tropicalis]|nr:hypothetical protein XENTR_v10000243 [Xenopus tropicalis]